MIHWLRLHTPNAESMGSIPGQEVRSHMLYGIAKKKKKNHNFKKLFLKNPHPSSE